MATTPHTSQTYLPNPDSEKDGIALCLSGGGFRAALFHLGAVRRLYEVGILDEVKTITAVSGGSTIAAHLAQQCDTWHRRNLSSDQWEQLIAAPFRALTTEDVGTAPLLKGWLPWNWSNNAGIEALANRFVARGLTTLRVQELPESPRFKFCATDLVSGNGWIFDRDNDEPWRVATAVAVSSCHPVAFRPFTRQRPQRIALVDGGLDDNRGVEPVWQTHQFLLISDGGDVLRPQWGQSILWSFLRSAGVTWNQSQVIQKRWFLSSFVSKQMQGAYWGIASAAEHYVSDRRTSSPRGYSAALARDVLAVVRTTYDSFSDAEAAALENHGYLLAEAATLAHYPQRGRRDAPLRIPHPAWMRESVVREALRKSATRRAFVRRSS